jgi:hypothetical protein
MSYKFSKHDKTEDGNFAKDIISFGNTIRKEIAYIIAGGKNGRSGKNAGRI